MAKLLFGEIKKINKKSVVVENSENGFKIVCAVPGEPYQIISKNLEYNKSIAVGMFCMYTLTKQNKMSGYEGFIINFYPDEFAKNSQENLIDDEEPDYLLESQRLGPNYYGRKKKNGSFRTDFDGFFYEFNRVSKSFTSFLKSFFIKTKEMNLSISEKKGLNFNFFKLDKKKPFQFNWNLFNNGSINNGAFADKLGVFFSWVVGQNRDVKIKTEIKTKVEVKGTSVDVEMNDNINKIKLHNLEVTTKKGFTQLKQGDIKINFTKNSVEIFNGDYGIYLDSKGKATMQFSELNLKVDKKINIEATDVNENIAGNIKVKAKSEINKIDKVDYDCSKLSFSDSGAELTPTKITSLLSSHKHMYVAPAIPAAPMLTTPDPMSMAEIKMKSINMPAQVMLPKIKKITPKKTK